MKEIHRKIFNNIYIKNFPLDWTEQNLRELCEPFGTVTSVIVQEHSKDGRVNKFGFVCFDSPEPAVKAVEILHEKELQGEKLYCREALKKADREREIKMQARKYKNSKKRCNLFIKNIPPKINQDQFEELFKPFGTIERSKLVKDSEDNNIYGFICYTGPESAQYARQTMHAK